MSKNNIYNDESNFDETVKKSKSKKTRNRIVAFLVTAAVVFAGVYMSSSKLFVIKNIRIVDSNSSEEIALPYTDKEFLEGLGVSEGMGMYEVSGSSMEKAALSNLTYIKEINISRRLPSTLVAKVVPDTPRYYVTLDDRMYILSENLKVLDVTDNIEQIELYKLILLRVGSIKKCVKGEKIVIDESTEDIILDIGKKLEDEGVISNITMLNIKDKFDIEMMYDTRFLVVLGDSKDMNNKIKMMNAIIKDKEGEMASGTIDVTKDFGKTGSLKKFG